MPTTLFTHTGNEAENTKEIKSLVLLIQDANTFNEVIYLRDQWEALIKSISSLFGLALINGPIGT